MISQPHSCCFYWRDVNMNNSRRRRRMYLRLAGEPRVYLVYENGYDFEDCDWPRTKIDVPFVGASACVLWWKPVEITTLLEPKLPFVALFMHMRFCDKYRNSSKEKRQNLYRRLTFKAGITFTNSTFCPHSVFMCFVWIWKQTAIISLYTFNWLVCITETESVYCAVRAEYIYN
jgi:hypothetical protein